MRIFISLILAILFFCIMIMLFGKLVVYQNPDLRPSPVTNFK
jgi:flagellar biogenesis protein FliO